MLYVKFAKLMPKHGIIFANHLSPKAYEEVSEIIKEVTTRSLTLITSKTCLIFCKEEVSIVFIISTLMIASITLVEVGWNITITFLFSTGKCIQGIQ
jgi:hypothetical protein